MYPELCAKPPDQPRLTFRASAVVVPTKHWFARASDASLWQLRLSALVVCGSLPPPAALICSLKSY